jgi:hypothetical protein
MDLVGFLLVQEAEAEAMMAFQENTELELLEHLVLLKLLNTFLALSSVLQLMERGPVAQEQFVLRLLQLEQEVAEDVLHHLVSEVPNLY